MTMALKSMPAHAKGCPCLTNLIYTTMLHKISLFLDAFTDPTAKTSTQIFSGLAWLVIISLVASICLFFAYVFQ